MLTRLNLVNFRNHAQTDLVGLKPLSVIVGPNGAGMSSILEAVWALYRLGSHLPRDTFGNHQSPRSLARSQQREMSISGGGTFGPERWSLQLGFDDEGGDWTSSVKAGVGEAEPTECDYRGERLQIPEWFLTGLGQVARYRLQASVLREPSYPENLPPTVARDGYGLASAVSYLMRTEPEAYRELSERLRSIMPSVTGLRTNPVKIPRARQHTLSVDNRKVPFNTEDEVVGDELLFDTVDGKGIQGSAQSDGTLLVLAILTALALPARPRLMLLDDIDAGLHPAAQRELMRVLRKLVDDDPGLQLIMTTHSPYIVDELSPEEVWVCGRDAADRRVVVKKLSEHPRAEEALHVLTTGEFWSTEGESWTAEKAG